MKLTLERMNSHTNHLLHLGSIHKLRHSSKGGGGQFQAKIV